MICGAGIDIVEVSRMAEIVRKWGDRFTSRVFTGAEMDYCSRMALPAMHYAARFAAKESLLKSLGIGLGMGVRLKDIEVIPDRRGKPEIRLQGKASDMLRSLKADAVHVSLTHTRQSAAAVVILEKK